MKVEFSYWPEPRADGEVKLPSVNCKTFIFVDDMVDSAQTLMKCFYALNDNVNLCSDTRIIVILQGFCGGEYILNRCTFIRRFLNVKDIYFCTR
jgi:orotate phosphoribosyltransferase-like protein